MFASIPLSAQESESCTFEALVIGKDISKCLCCGGWQVKVGEHVYLTNEISQLSLSGDDTWTSEFPIPIKINFGVLEFGCDNRIVILCLEIINNSNQ
jgi:hypothetical protein